MKWISVQDRLPKTFEPVIVCREIGGGEVKVEQGYKDVGDWWKVYGTRDEAGDPLDAAAGAAAGRTGKSRKEERVMEVSRRIRAYMELQGMVPMEMAAALQMGKTTFYGG